MGEKSGVLEEALSWLSSFIIFVMMALTSVDVFMRYMVSRPIAGAFEVGEILMALLVFSALPLVSLRNEHVTVEFAEKLIPSRLAPYVDSMVQLFIAALMFATGWLLWQRAPRVQQYGDATTALEIPIWPLLYVMGTLLMVTGGIHVYKAIRGFAAR